MQKIEENLSRHKYRIGGMGEGSKNNCFIKENFPFKNQVQSLFHFLRLIAAIFNGQFRSISHLSFSDKEIG